MRKAKSTTKQQGRTTTKASQRSQAQKTKGPAKKGINSRKRPVSDGSDEESSEPEPEGPRARKKKKARHMVEEELDDGEGEDNVKQVVDREDDDTGPEGVEQVSFDKAIFAMQLTCSDHREATLRCDTVATFRRHWS
jgi:hypothetical protein